MAFRLLLYFHIFHYIFGVSGPIFLTFMDENMYKNLIPSRSKVFLCLQMRVQEDFNILQHIFPSTTFLFGTTFFSCFYNFHKVLHIKANQNTYLNSFYYIYNIKYIVEDLVHVSNFVLKSPDRKVKKQHKFCPKLA